MMAYDDAFRLLFWLFILALPLIVLLPKKGIPAGKQVVRGIRTDAAFAGGP